MTSHREIHLLLTTAAALGLSSCAVKDGRLDFTWWQDAAAPVMEDDVIIEAGGSGYYRSAPAPARVPAAAIPREKPETPAPAPEPIVAQQQPAQQPPPPAPKRKPARRTKPVATPGTHVVQPGDTLSAISRKYGTTVSALVAANGMANANVPLQINQVLNVSATGNEQTAPPAPSPAKPAATPAPLQPAAPAPAPKPAPASGVYTIKAGDTIYKISRQQGISPAALMQANGLTPETANTIRVGATLRIPAAN